MAEFDTSLPAPEQNGKIRANNAQEARATYWYQESEGKRKRIWNAGRRRGLEKVEERLGGELSEKIEERIAARGKIRILEVGCGYARSLLEIRSKYGTKVSLDGINIEPGYNTELVRDFARDHNLDSGDGDFPTIHIHDADDGLPFSDKTFDVVYSIATIHSLKDKLAFLQEVNRILAEDGVALLDMCLTPTNNRDMAGNPMPDQYCRRLEIWEDGVYIDFYDWVKRFPQIKVGKGVEDPYVALQKCDGLETNLELVSSIFLYKLCKSWWGCKSIYAFPHGLGDPR